MLQQMLKYYLECNLYFLDKVDILLTYFTQSENQLENKIEQIAWEKLGEQGGRYYLELSDAKIKKYLSYNEDKAAMVIFFVWLGLSDEYINELTAFRRTQDIYNKAIEILNKWIKDIY